MDPCDPLPRMKTDGGRGHSSFDVHKNLAQKNRKRTIMAQALKTMDESTWKHIPLCIMVFTLDFYFVDLIIIIFVIC